VYDTRATFTSSHYCQTPVTTAVYQQSIVKAMLQRGLYLPLLNRNATDSAWSPSWNLQKSTPRSCLTAWFTLEYGTWWAWTIHTEWITPAYGEADDQASIRGAAGRCTKVSSTLPKQASRCASSEASVDVLERNKK